MENYMADDVFVSATRDEHGSFASQNAQSESRPMADNAAVLTYDEQSAEDSVAAVEETRQTEEQTEHEDVSRTKAFSQRLNTAREQWERERSSRDSQAIRALGLQNPYTGEPVETLDSLIELQRMQEFDAQGQDPQTALRMQQMSSQLAEYQLREQDSALAADPAWGSIYEQYRDRVMEIAEVCRQNGEECDLRLALQAVAGDDLPQLIADAVQNAQAQAQSQRMSNASASPGRLGGAPVGDSVSYATMSDAEFEQAVKRAMRGELSAN